jgi:hypothetical protein
LGAPPLVQPAVVTASLLRSIRLAELIDKHFVTFKTRLTSQDSDGTVYTIETGDYTATRRRGGPPPKYGPEHFAEVARVYREAYSNNRKPTRAVAQHFTRKLRHGVSESAAAKWVFRCRNLGLLPQTTRGKARAVEPSKRKRTRRKKG